MPHELKRRISRRLRLATPSVKGRTCSSLANILEGHFGGGESVNCSLTERQNVDIYLVLVTVRPSTLDLTNYDTECTSAMAEIDGHRRPIDWEVLGRMMSTASANKLTGAQARLTDKKPAAADPRSRSVDVRCVTLSVQFRGGTARQTPRTAIRLGNPSCVFN